MRVCFIIPGFADGGAQKQCIFLLNELQTRDDIQLSLIRFHTEEVHDHLLERKRIEVFDVAERSNYDPRNALEAAAFVRKIRPDLLLSWLHAADVYSYLVRTLQPGLRWIMTERNSAYPRELRFRLRELLGRSADAIVSNSVPGDRLWQHLGAHGQRYVVDNIVPPLQTPSIAAPGASVIYVGRLEEQKNILVTTEAFCRLAARRPDLSFSIIGKGRLEVSVREVIAAHSMQPRVRLLGFRNDVPAQLLGTKALVALSHHEGMPNSILEAVAMGTPILASDIDEHRDLLGSDYPFYVRNRADPIEIADRIEQVVDHGLSPGHLSFARAKLHQMTARAVADRYIDIFRAVLK